MCDNLLLDSESEYTGCPECDSSGRVGNYVPLPLRNGLMSRVWTPTICPVCNGDTFITKEAAFEYKIKVSDE